MDRKGELYFFLNVTGHLLIKNIQQRDANPGIDWAGLVGDAIDRVETVVHGYESNFIGGEKLLDIVADCNKLSAQPREILYDQAANFPINNILNHILKTRPLKGRPTESIIDVEARNRKLVLLCPVRDD